MGQEDCKCESPIDRKHLGDGVWVELERSKLKLVKEEGIGPPSVIYLDSNVYTALTSYVAKFILV